MAVKTGTLQATRTEMAKRHPQLCNQCLWINGIQRVTGVKIDLRKTPHLHTKTHYHHTEMTVRNRGPLEGVLASNQRKVLMGPHTHMDISPRVEVITSRYLEEAPVMGAKDRPQVLHTTVGRRSRTVLTAFQNHPVHTPAIKEKGLQAAH